MVSGLASHHTVSTNVCILSSIVYKFTANQHRVCRGSWSAMRAFQKSLREDDLGTTKDALDAIESIRNGLHRPKESPLPGHGEIRDGSEHGKKCGVKEEPRYCANCGDWYICGNTCNRWECPRCYKSPNLDRSVDITAKLQEHREVVEMRRDNESDAADKLDKPHAHRIIVSLPDDFSTVSENPIDRATDAVKDILKAGTFGDTSGGVIVPHLYRSEDSDGIQDDRGFWKDVLPDYDDDYTPSWSDTRQKLSLEPHFHCYLIADKFWVDTDYIEDETGWVIRRLEPYGDKDNHESVRNVSHLTRSVMYALSHAPVSDGNMYSYFGDTHNISSGEQTEAWVDELARSHASKILGLSTNINCNNEVAEGEQNSCYRGYSDSDDDSDSKTESDRVNCGGRLLHIRTLDRFLDDNDWKDGKERELRELREWYFEDIPPPDFID